MTITLAPETEARLLEKAKRTGTDVNVLASKMLETSMLEGEDEFLACVKGIQRGLDDFAAGRSRPFSEFAAEQRAKHNLPSENAT